MVHVIRLVIALCLPLPGLAGADTPPQSFRIIEDTHSRTVRYLPEEPSGTAVILLDAVPWDETIEAAPRLQPLPLLSMTSESSSMNAWLKVEAQIRTGTIEKAP